MENFFEKNVSNLKPLTPTVNQLENRLPDTITVQETSSGVPTIKHGNLLIHSSYDPVKEGDSFAKSVKPGDRIFLYGFGLGYHIKPILNRIGPEGSLLVVELNQDILSAAMILLDQTDLLLHDQLHLIFGTEEAEIATEISRHMDSFGKASDNPSSQVLLYSPAFKCIPKHFERLANAFEILLIERRVPAVFGNLESRNYTFNKDLVRQSPGVRSLRGKHLNQSAVLISAGPSFDDVIPYLGRVQETSLLACVDTALPVLVHEGVSPDYVFSLDPQDESFKHFQDYLEKPFKLIYTPTANCKIIHQFSGEKFVVFKEDHSLFSKNDPLIQEKGTTRAGGSVSCMGLDCLIQLGCNPIVLIGQDCAYSGNRLYSRHTITDEQILQLVNFGLTLPLLHQDKAREKKRIFVNSYNGSKILTNQVLYSYLRNIEEIAQVYPQTQLYNLFAHGAGIENATPLGSINEILRILNS